MPDERIEGMSKNSKAPFIKSNYRAHKQLQTRPRFVKNEKKRLLTMVFRNTRQPVIQGSRSQIVRPTRKERKNWSFKGLDLTAHFIAFQICRK
jgi:hypothetical protein